jgi:nitronate monooxygenase
MNQGQGEFVMTEPLIIQGGMGAGVSNWVLARAVSKTGQLGVVSGTALDSIMARRLQNGDTDGAMRRALGAFPDSAIAKRILDRYFVTGGKQGAEPFRPIPMFGMNPSKDLLELNVAASKKSRCPFFHAFMGRSWPAWITCWWALGFQGPSRPSWTPCRSMRKPP